MSTIPTLVTPRLRLERLTESHALEWFQGLRDPALYRYLDEPPPADLDALTARFRRLAAGAPPERGEVWLNWAARSLPDGRAAGWLQATVHAERSAHVAYVLFRSAWGRGLAREAQAAVIGYLAEAHGITRALARVDPRHRRSIAVLEALGFRGVGTRKGAGPGRPPRDLLFQRSLDPGSLRRDPDRG